MTVSSVILPPVTHWAETQTTKSRRNAANILVAAPLSLITYAIDIIIGLGAILASMATLGKINKLTKFAENNLHSTFRVLLSPYRRIIDIVNPRWWNKGVLEAKVSIHGPLFNPYVLRFGPVAEECRKSKNIFVRHVASRACYTLRTIVFAITKLADTIIGVAAGILSILALGRFNSLNNIAYRGLRGETIVSFSILSIINPWVE